MIIGNQASEVRAAPIFPEYTVSWIEKEIDDLADRPGAGFAVSEENKRVLHEVCPWWRGQTVQDRCYGMFTDEQKGLLATGIIKAEGNMTSGDAHLAVNFPLLLEKGLDGLREKVAERRSRINLTVLEDLHGEQFLKAIDIVLVAVSEHIERFAAPRVKWPRPKPAKAVAMNCWRWQKPRSYRPPTAADFLAGAATVLLHPVDIADRI